MIHLPTRSTLFPYTTLFRSLIYEAMKKKGIDTNAIFSRLGVDEQYVYTDQLRTPHNAQLYFWQAVEDVSGDEDIGLRSEEHTSELQSRPHLVCRLLLEKKKY